VEQIEAGSLTVPFPREAFLTLELATYEQLVQLQEAFALSPGILAAPAALRTAVELAPTTVPGGDDVLACSDIYSDFNQIVSLTEVNKNLTFANNVVGLLRGILGTVLAIVNATTTICEVPIPIPLSSVQVPIILVMGALDIASLGLSTAVDAYGFQIWDLWRCLNTASCPPQGFSERFRPDDAPNLVGKGCDNRDNNCSGGIDERTEDVSPPRVGIDGALASRCYDDAVEAEAAARLAVRASDDCVDLSEDPESHQGTLSVQFSRAACLGTVVANATDRGGSAGSASAMFAVDDVAPSIVLQDLTGTCQPSVEAARQALGFTATDSCSTPETAARVLEKECVADFEFEAEDACGNRATARQSVRLDDSPPAVKVETLLLPTFEGRFCFDGQPAALDTVAEATTLGDNCSSRSELAFTTSAQPVAGGNACDRRIVAAATDACSLHSEDAVTVRLDGEVPSLSCSVQNAVLWPASGTLVNVGFQYDLADNCGNQDVKLEVAVTSDEPTSFNLPVGGAGDPSPDAVVQYAADGRPSAILLRAERQQTVSADGRVYRIRLAGTDACGNRSVADCWVNVPKVLDGTSSQLTNSGQRFDATVVD
jgi:hypothetical protein